MNEHFICSIKRDMNVLMDYQIFYLQEYGGVSRYHIELCKELRKLDKVDVNICIKYNINEYLKKYMNIEKTKYPDNFILKKIKRCKDKLSNEMRCYKSAKTMDVIHITWTNPYLNNCYNNKMIVTIHDMIHELFWKDDSIYKKEIENKKRSIFESTAIIAISENTKKDIIKIYPEVDENKIRVIYHGTNHLPKPSKLKDTLPDKYILYVGARGEYKGARFFLENVADVLTKKNIMAIFVGGGTFSQEELKLHRHLNIENFVKQLQVTDAELAYLYKNAICFVYPSEYEGFGFPILEAFDNECPVICTNSSSLPEVGGNAAIYFDKNDGNGLKNAVINLIENEHLRQDCIIKGKERIKFFSWEKCAKETYQLYSEVMLGLFSN